MKFVYNPVLLFLPLCFSIVLAVLKFLLAPSYDLWELLRCPLFMYAVINAILFAILLENGYRLSGNESEDNLPIVLIAYETNEERAAEDTSEKVSNGYDEDAAESDNDNNDKNISEYHGSYHGSEVDGDGNGSEEERDLEFERRIEAFIAKVVEGWREERVQQKKFSRKSNGWEGDE